MTEKPSTNILSIHYKFRRSNGVTIEFQVDLDRETLKLIRPHERQSYPDWTRLPYHKCINCPLDSAEHVYCPVATGLVDVIEFCKDEISWEEVDVEIITEARTYTKRTSMQNGLSSLIGIYMVTSGCPILDRLRPMVGTHLPFATVEETMYRSISTYLMAQYFLYKTGKKPDWDLENLVKIYENVRIVNQSFFKRIQHIHTQDAGLNAINQLDCLANLTNMALLETGLEEIELLFDAYLKNEPQQPTAKN